MLFKNGPIFVRLAFLLNFDLIFIGVVNYDDAKILQIWCLEIFNPDLVKMKKIDKFVKRIFKKSEFIEIVSF